MASSSSSSTPPNELLVDDSYFSVLSDSEEDIFPISDEKYAVGLQLQEALMSCLVASATQISSQSSGNEVEMRENKTLGESSSSKAKSKGKFLFCEICMEGKPEDDMFNENKCCHSFCSDCISKHIAAKIQVSINSVTCPDLNCKRVLEPESCRSVVPAVVFDRWMNALCESFVLGSQKFYCPFKDCSALLVDDGGETVMESECPNCRRLFCAQCKVAWHSGISCENFQRLNVDERGREDIMLMELAKKKNWNRCPNCRFYVEKKDGCLHISCRCGFDFCYGCGARWTSSHGGCQRV